MLPMLVLALLGVLSAGAVVLGLELAPATADLVVHNGAGELLAAPSLTAIYSSKTSHIYYKIVFESPDRATESLLADGPNSPPSRSVHVTGTGALMAVSPFSAMETVTGFEAVGPRFVAERSAKSLSPAALRSRVSGTIRYSVSVVTGYLVDVVESFHIVFPAGAESGTDDYRVTRIAGQAAPGR